jgi:diacylglycerol kinase
MDWFLSRIRAFRHAGRGVRLLLAEAHGRVHGVAALAVILAGLFVGISAKEWALLVICMALVLAAEAINSSLERIVDLASPEWHGLARDAKDLAAGAVLILAIAAVVVGLLVFLPYL